MVPSDKRPTTKRKGHHSLVQLDLPLYVGGEGRGRAGGGGRGSAVALFTVEGSVAAHSLDDKDEGGDFGLGAVDVFGDKRDREPAGSVVGGGLSLNSTIIVAALPDMWTGPWNRTPWLLG